MRSQMVSMSLALACLLAVGSSARAQSYFYGYYYPGEGRFRTDQLARPNLDIYGSPFAGTSAPANANAITGPTPAKIRVILPDPAAKVWFASYATTSTGTDRLFQSVPLPSGNAYQFPLRATFMQAGKEVTQERTIIVAAGQTTLVDFATPTQTSAAK